MSVRIAPLLLTPALMLVLSGCLVDSTLDDKGGGTMKVELRGSATDTLSRVKARFTSDNSEITSATMDDQKNAVVELKYKDFTKLNTLPQFKEINFSLTSDAKAKTKTASATTKHDKPITFNDEQLAYFGKELSVSITVPGEVVKTNGQAKDKTVTWKMPLNTYLSAPETLFSVTYKADVTAATAGTPAAGAAQDAAAAKDAKPAATPKKK